MTWEKRWKGKSAKHKRIWRNLDYYLGKVLERGRGYTIDEVRDALAEETGFHFTKPTLRGLVDRYTKSHGISPINEYYYINDSFYDSFESRSLTPEGYVERKDSRNLSDD